MRALISMEQFYPDCEHLSTDCSPARARFLPPRRSAPRHDLQSVRRLLVSRAEHSDGQTDSSRSPTIWFGEGYLRLLVRNDRHAGVLHLRRSRDLAADVVDERGLWRHEPLFVF